MGSGLASCAPQCPHLVQAGDVPVFAAIRKQSAANSTVELNCTTDCTSKATWSYSAASSSDPAKYSSSARCLQDGRCRVKDDKLGSSLLSWDQVQLVDDGAYLCRAGTTNQSDYCEMSFQLTVTGQHKACSNNYTVVQIKIYPGGKFAIFRQWHKIYDQVHNINFQLINEYSYVSNRNKLCAYIKR